MKETNKKNQIPSNNSPLEIESKSKETQLKSDETTNSELKKNKKSSVKNQDDNKNISFLKKVNKWYRECKSEIKKVVWPDKKQVINNTIAVLIMVFISVVFISILDIGFGWIIKLILNKF